MKDQTPIPTKTRQMLQALLFSKDLDAGLLAYEFLAGKTDYSKSSERIKDFNDEGLKIFWKYVFAGNYEQAVSCANEENALQLGRINIYQMLQALLACEDKETGRNAYLILSGRLSLETARKEHTAGFMHEVLQGNVTGAKAAATELQLLALTENKKPEITIKLNTVQNLQRLNYLMFDNELDGSGVGNVMIKAFYEIGRADDHAEGIQKEKPQNYFI